MASTLMKDTYRNLEHFGVHIGKNGTTYSIWTGYRDGNLCAFSEPTVKVVDTEFFYINAILWQALEHRKARDYFDSYKAPKPLIYD